MWVGAEGGGGGGDSNVRLNTREWPVFFNSGVQNGGRKCVCGGGVFLLFLRFEIFRIKSLRGFVKGHIIHFWTFPKT